MKITKYFAIVAFVVGMNSCNYLDIIPKGQSVIESTEDFNGLLESFKPAYGMDNYLYIPEEAIHYKADEVLNYKFPVFSASFLWDESYDRAKMIVSDDLYNTAYSRIAHYNIILDGIDDSKGPKELKIRTKAQARVLRALNYFHLVNTYAKPYDPATAATDRGIVLRKEFNMEDIPGQSTIQEVYDLMLEDVNTAIPDLPAKRENIYRPGKAFGYAMKSKIHLYKGELQESLNAALEVLKYDVGLWDLESYAEAKKANPFTNVDMDMPECLLFGYGTGPFAPEMTHIIKDVVDLFSANDLRKKLFLQNNMAHPAVEPGSLCFGTYNCVKWNLGGIRLSEVYLIIAECYARMGDKDNAVKWINELRKYRFYKDQVVDVTAKDAAEARQLVVNERRMELMLTCNTFFDMKRYTVIPEYRKTLTKTFKGKEYKLEPNSHLYIIPFSIEAMESNKNLIQNSK